MQKILATVLLSLFACALAAGASADGTDDAIQKQAKELFGPLPEVMTSPDNPVTPEKVRLGKMLFYEWRISSDGTVSCNRCHQFNFYATDALRKAIGVGCKVNPRNSPTVFNAAAQISEHWIGNRKSVEDQARQSVLGKAAFGMSSDEAVVEKLKELGYVPFFKSAFPVDQDPVTIDNFALAIGAYERTLVTPSAFDDYLVGKGGMTEAQKTGLKTFIDTGCVACHSGTYVGGEMYQKFGIFEPYWKLTKSVEIDDGRYTVTKNDSDKYFFKVPILRNAEKTSPYFHDGSVENLTDAVKIMAKLQLNKDLDDRKAGEIVAFLGSLTGRLSGDILEVPVLP